MFRLLLVFILSCLTANFSISAKLQRVEIKKLSDIKNDTANRYYVIETTIEVENDITIGERCVLCFKDDGRLVGKPKENGEFPTLTLKNTAVRAWDVCIFENIKIAGKFTNSYIPAEWFGTEDMDDAEMINTALEQAPDYVVRLTRKSYSLNDTICMKQRGQRLEAAGCLNLNKDIPAITMYNQFQQVNFGTIASKGSTWNALKTYHGKGIKLAGDTYHCDISVRGLYGLSTAYQLSKCRRTTLVSTFITSKGRAQVAQ